MDNSTQANNLLAKVAEGKLGIKSGEDFSVMKQNNCLPSGNGFAQKLIHQLKASEYYK